MIGLSGAHRSGKTTLAEAFAKKNGVPLIRSEATKVIQSLGLPTTGGFDFATRLMVQEKILDRLDEQCRGVTAGLKAISDRTPLDFLTYTLAEAVGDAVREEDQERLNKFTDKCFEVLNKRFSMLVVVQPGIPLVEEEGKGSLNKAYLEHYNSLLLGLTVGERVKVPHFYLPRSMLDLNARVNSLERATGRVETAHMEQLASASQNGILVH